MSTAKPLRAYERIARYRRQRNLGALSRITPRQARRTRHKTNRAISQGREW